MAVSKYASLPDVDTSGLEAFETPDVVSPGVRRVRTYDDSDADDDDDDDSEAAEERTRAAAARGQRAGAEEIDGATLDVREAQRRFESSAGVDAAQADFSQSIAPRRKSKAKPRGGARSPSPHTYESRGFASFSPAAASASASSSAESRAARLRRLQAEAAELAADLAETHAREGGSYEDVVAPPNGAAEASSTTEMMRQVQALRQSLGAASTSTSAQREQTGQQWHARTRHLLNGLASSSEAKTRATRPDAPTTTQHTAADSTAPEHGAPPMAEGKLERRIAQMEETVGVRAMLDPTALPARGVLPTLSRLEALLSLLSQPRHLDSLQRRLNLLLPVLEKASSARKALDGGVGPPLATLSAGAAAADETRSSSSTGLPEEQLQRLARLFPVLERVEPMLPLVPALLSRLQSLASLHAAASSVIADLAALQHAQTHASTQHNEMAELLKGVAESMRNNQQTVKANLEALEQRLESLDERVAKLGS